jgi:hypothetical protein
MATIIGTSDAWESVCLELNRINLKPDKPSEIYKFLEIAQEEYNLAKVKATQEIQNKIESLKKDIELRETNTDADIQRGKGKLVEEMESATLILQSIQGTLIQKLFNYFKIRKQRELLRRLKRKHDNYPILVQRKISRLEENLIKTQGDIEILIEKEIQTISRKVKLLEKVIKSPEFAGSIAELELIDSLRELPENHYVINNVKIEIRKPILFDGTWLKSAQIDHVVVTTSGIFAIEVKNWSTKFVLEGDYFNPYQQVKRSAYLCHKLIGEKFNIKTRSIIAYKGSIPKKPLDSYAKVLPISDVGRYILWFKDEKVSNQAVESIATLFTHRYH